jgi:Mrp family chromosome partitioning ATPase
LILSGKGGVGKTTLTVNLAWELARQGFKVGLLDIDFHGPDLGEALYLKADIKVDDRGKLLPVLATPNLWVLTVQHLLAQPDDAVMWRGPRKMRAILQFLSDTSWPELDYFFVDSPPGTGDETLTIIGHIPDIKALVVCTGHSLAISDVTKAINCLKQKSVDIFGLLENMGSLICPKCHEEILLYEGKEVLNLAQKCGISLLASFPLDPKAVRIADEIRKPLVEAAPDSIFSEKIRDLSKIL